MHWQMKDGIWTQVCGSLESWLLTVSLGNLVHIWKQRLGDLIFKFNLLNPQVRKSTYLPITTWWISLRIPSALSRGQCQMLRKSVHHGVWRVWGGLSGLWVREALPQPLSQIYRVSWLLMVLLLGLGAPAKCDSCSVVTFVTNGARSQRARSHGLGSPPVSSLHGILQARILEWVAIPFSRGSSQPRDRTQVSCIAGRFFTFWATREVPGEAPSLS